MDIRKALHECNTGNHDLIEVARFGYSEEEQQVVMWCKTCGAVVGDYEYDGRTQPGGMFKMMGPQALKLVQIYYD